MTIAQIFWRVVYALSAIGYGWAFYNHIHGIVGFEITKGLALIVAMSGLYAAGTDVVICHTGTSPNGSMIAKSLTGAWNFLHKLASTRAVLEGKQ